jgi:hypothetical protein
LSFLKTADPDTVSNIPEENVLKIYSENIPVTGKPSAKQIHGDPVRPAPRNTLYLSGIILPSRENPSIENPSMPAKNGHVNA